MFCCDWLSNVGSKAPVSCGPVLAPNAPTGAPVLGSITISAASSALKKSVAFSIPQETAPAIKPDFKASSKLPPPAKVPAAVLAAWFTNS